MIRTLAISKDDSIIFDDSAEKLFDSNVSWFWMDFCDASQEEFKILQETFKFHQLSLEDCLFDLERPKLDYYEEYNFVVVHSLDKGNLTPNELDIFIGCNFIITFHYKIVDEVDLVFKSISNNSDYLNKEIMFIVYLIFDKIVDEYFPIVYSIEDAIDKLNIMPKSDLDENFINEVFDIRSDLLKARRTVNSMRDLVYRVVNSKRVENSDQNKVFFMDVYDHLLKLSEMIESNREMTNDLRDSYVSMNSNKMNRIMMVLTVITTIFIPLSFIAGVYGMNFEFMPELRYKYGYFIVLGIMVIVGISMYRAFKLKGWFKP